MIVIPGSGDGSCFVVPGTGSSVDVGFRRTSVSVAIPCRFASDVGSDRGTPRVTIDVIQEVEYDVLYLRDD